jgi:hypothetical protein
VRITAQVRPDNQQANRSVRRLGFQFEGFQRFAIEGRWDANLYGMLANECRYLPKVRPPLSKLDLADMDLVDTEARRDLALRASSGSDGAHLVRGQLGHFVALAVLVIGMAGSFGSILFPARPAQMALVDTGAIATAVGGVWHSFRRGTIHPSADQIVNADDATFQVHLPISVTVERVGPDQALAAFMREDDRQVTLNNAGMNHPAIVGAMEV